MADSNIGVEVLRDPSYVINDLMEFRNEKVERDIDMPIEYKVGSYISDGFPENSFYKTYANSCIEMVPRPPSYIPEVQEIVEILSVTKGVSAPIEAKPKNIAVHEPVLREAYEELDNEGYTTLTAQEAHARGRTVEGTLEDLEDRGIETVIRVEKAPWSSFRGMDIFLDYDAEDQTFSPEIGRKDPGVERERVEQAEEELEDLLKDYGL